MSDLFANRMLDEGAPNDDQSNGHGQSAPPVGVWIGIGALFLGLTVLSLVHGLSSDGNARSWIALTAALLAAAASLITARRTWTRTKPRRTEGVGLDSSLG